MYDIRVLEQLERIKSVLVNYINALHVFSKNKVGPLLKFISKIFYTKNTRGWEDFSKSEGGHGPPRPPFLRPCSCVNVL